MKKNMSNPDVCFLVLARPADVLCTLTRQVLPCHQSAAKVCNSVYEAVAFLHTLEHNRPVILIARPSMLAKPHLAAVLRQYPNLRLVGWLANEEHPAPVQTEQPMIGVSTFEQLIRVITAICNTLTNEQTPPETAQPHKQASQLDPADYRLSNDELNALLGAER